MNDGNILGFNIYTLLNVVTLMVWTRKKHVTNYIIGMLLS